MASRPSLLVEDQPYLDGYRILDRARSTGYSGYLPITVGEIRAYLDLIKEDGVDRRLRFLRHIQEMDRAFLEHVAKAAESNK